MLDFLFSPPAIILFIFLIIINRFFKSINSGSSRSMSRLQRANADRKRERPRLTLADLVARLGMSKADLVEHEVQYRATTIPKRSGGKRVLHVPDRLTKTLQRKLLYQIIGRLPLHDNVHGFRKGHSIVDNAANHTGQEVILKLDIVDFFPSTSSKRIAGAFEGAGFDKSTAVLLTGFTCWEGGLPQGAPTSPALSNYVNKNMDKKLAAAASGRGARYTRYADDITFSFQRYSRDNIHQLLISTGKILQYYGYRLNNKKKRIIRRHRQQLVTGLVVNDRVNLPRKTRRWLRSVKHRMETGGQATLSSAEFHGWLALLRMVDPDSALLEFVDVQNANKKNMARSRMKDSNSQSVVAGQSEIDDKFAKTAELASLENGDDAIIDNALHETVEQSKASSASNEISEVENHKLVKAVEVLTQTAQYTENRKKAEVLLTGGEYLIEISATSVGRTFSFSLPKVYQNGQTLKGTLHTEGMSLELYFDEKLGSKVAALQLPREFRVLVKVVQWNAIFKRLEAIVLRAML